MPVSDEARRAFAEWDSLPKPSRRFQQKVQDQAEINAILSDPDHPATKVYRAAEAEAEARYYADAYDDEPDEPLTPEEIAGRDWNKWPPHPPLSPEHKAASDRFRNAVDDAMGAQPDDPDYGAVIQELHDATEAIREFETDLPMPGTPPAA